MNTCSTLWIWTLMVILVVPTTTWCKKPGPSEANNGQPPPPPPQPGNTSSAGYSGPSGTPPAGQGPTLLGASPGCNTTHCNGVRLGKDEEKAEKMKIQSAMSQKGNLTDEDLEAIWALAYDVKVPPGADIPQRPLGGTKFTIMRRSVSWFRAHENCMKRGMILATFVKPETYEMVAKLIFDFSVYDESETNEWLGSRRYWMGLSDLGMEGEWRWFDTGEVLTYNDKWNPGQPDHIGHPPWYTHWIRRPNAGGGKKEPAHCGLMWNPTFGSNETEGRALHVWDDSECIGEGRYYYFICQSKHFFVDGDTGTNHGLAPEPGAHIVPHGR